MKYSILIPAYNAATTIERCLESLPLDREDVEIILMNDGSTDNIDQVIKKYLKRIMYIKKENTKLADTRNKLIKEASGKYFVFVDSDDYVNKDMFNRFDTIIEKNKTVDLISFGLDIVDIDNRKIGEYKKLKTELITGEKILSEYVKNKVVIDPAVGYLYKKDYFTKNKFTYPIGYNHEDYATTVLTIIKAKRVISLDENYYYYIQTDNSIVRGNYDKLRKNIQDVLYHSKNHIKYINQEKLTGDIKKYFSSYIANILISNINKLKDEDKTKYLKDLKKMQIANYLCSDNLKQKLKKIYYKYFIIK